MSWVKIAGKLPFGGFTVEQCEALLLAAGEAIIRKKPRTPEERVGMIETMLWMSSTDTPDVALRMGVRVEDRTATVRWRIVHTELTVGSDPKQNARRPWLYFQLRLS